MLYPLHMEQWRPVADYEGLYDVSDLGNVRATRRRGSRGDVLRPGIGAGGKRTVVLHRNGVRETRLVCHLVLEAWTGPRGPGQVCRHGPGGALDDRHVNLCWGSQADNVGADRVRDGTSNRGERQWQAKLTEAIVSECRRRYAAGETQGTLAAEFGISPASMSQVISGARWAWLPGAIPVDKKRHGKGGTAHHAAKLTPELIEQARARCANGERQRDVAASMGVSQGTIWKAINGLTWTKEGTS